MKNLLRLLSLYIVATVPLSAADDRVVRETTLIATPDNLRAIAAARAADEERIAATKSGDRSRLDAIFSDDLVYGHSSGVVDSKASYMDTLVSKRTVYESFDYQQRDFKVAGPGVVIMSGRVFIKARNATGRSDNDLIFLAVWREEKGQWRFLGWQSCKVPPPVAPTPAVAR